MYATPRMAQTAIDTTLIPIFWIAPDARILYANDAACRSLGYAREELLRMSIPDIDPEWPREYWESEGWERLKRAGLSRFEARTRHKNGTLVPVEVFSSYFTVEGEEILLAMFPDITARKQAEAAREEDKQTVLRDREGHISGTLSSGEDITDRRRIENNLRYRLELENLLAEISTRFISLPSRLIDAEIERTLELIGRFCGVDHAAVFRFSSDKKSARQTSTWCRGPEQGNLMRRVQSTKAASFPWASKLIFSGKPLFFTSLDALPQEAAATRALFESIGFESGLLVPMMVVGEVLGFIMFSCTRERRHWSEDEVTLLKVVGQIISNALERKRVEDELRQAVGEVARLKEQLEAENVYLREEVRKSHGFEGLVGESDAFLDVLRKVEQVSPTDASVLVMGETGTGKELIAHAIHSRSPRAARPLVKVNCAALPGTLIESELFGHEKGAFTGATARREGRFELADGGTIFLDEIGDLPLELQTKLLRVLQDGEFERLGSTRTLRVDVRVIAATNRDLEKAIEAGSFRVDLYYRLSVFPIAVPPLRERRKDIPLLVWHCVAQSQERLGKRIDKMPREVMDKLIAYDWPGNVRELRNVIERAAILSPGSVLRINEWFAGTPKTEDQAPNSSRLEEFERSHILRVIGDCDWKIRGPGNAADRLGMNPSTLRSRMKKLGILRPA